MGMKNLKLFQTFNLMRLVNVEMPENVNSFLDIFSKNALTFIPQPLITDETRTVSTFVFKANRSKEVVNRIPGIPPANATLSPEVIPEATESSIPINTTSPSTTPNNGPARILLNTDIHYEAKEVEISEKTCDLHEVLI